MAFDTMKSLRRIPNVEQSTIVLKGGCIARSLVN
jgi:hypothetical protein